MGCSGLLGMEVSEPRVEAFFHNMNKIIISE